MPINDLLIWKESHIRRKILHETTVCGIIAIRNKLEDSLQDQLLLLEFLRS